MGLQCDPNGRIWVATHEGLATISPERWLLEKERSSSSKLILSQLHLDNNLVPSLDLRVFRSSRSSHHWH